MAGSALIYGARLSARLQTSFAEHVLRREGNMRLSHPELWRKNAFINGIWVEAASGTRMDVHDPATGETVGSVPDMDKTDADRAVDAATEAFPAWRDATAGHRASLLKKWHELILRHADDLALIMTLEQGKPLSESKGEIAYAASFVEWFSEEARRAYGDIIPSHAPDKRILALKQPVGVVAAITPWNFPSAMITRKVAPALAVGCSVLVKPSELTPLSALALAFLAQEAGFPPGVFNVITTSSPETFSEAVMNRADVRKISFTGSTRVGKMLMGQAAASIKRLSLELGGNAPFIVFDDADLEKAVQGAIASKYRNAGQTCVCANRIFVQDSIHDEFLSRYRRAVSAVNVGPGIQESSDIGPLINEAAVEKVEGLLNEAQAAGATLLIGGKRHERGGTYFEPTIVTGVTDSMSIAKTEIFGPVSSVFRFTDEAEVVRRANDTPFGLAAYFYTTNLARSWRVSEGLDYGIVGINTGLISTPVAPFGGMKESGLGREGSKYGIEEFLEIKYVCVGEV
jgi:succinate-semialdehyde dehydrogenase/glutarate-semialdehyde dehydrogenase